jgi:PAS domain S-box-containing protein
MAQFTPHLILAALRGGNDPWAGRVSLGAGLALWIYTLGLPPILPVHWLVALAGGPFDPLHLLGSRLGSPLAHGVIWSLGVNLVVLALVSLRKASPRQMGVPIGWPIRSRQRVSNIGDLARLTAAFVGKERVEREFPASSRAQPVDRTAAHRAQELIATVIGASPARALVASALASGQMSLAAVTRLLGEGGQSLRFSRQLLAATFENMDAGISVVDAELNLVAWNTRYLDLFAYPPGMVRAGMPVADLIRYNALRGDFGAGDADFHVAKRLKALRRRVEHSFERHRRDGRVVKTVGGPMPGGGYVTSFTDITEEARIRAELTATLAELEQRVGDRTVELSDANRRLAEATRDKTRFLAAASHDLLQPLHAARLFTAALARDTGLTRPELVGRVERSIVAAENLLRALLDISKLDAGGVQPAPEPIDLAPFLRDIAEGVRPLAEEQGLTLRLGPLTGAVESDPGLLRSVLQNFLTNAVRYTPHGGILLGVRQRGAELRIDVIDTGIGIPPDQQQAIFTEFTRLGELDAEGLGLGLAIARRITWLLGGRIELVSTPGRGSRFSLALPARAAIPLGEAAPVRPTPGAHTSPLAVLVVDNQPEIVAASLALLAGMGHHGMGAATPAEALRQAGAADVVLADYDLGRGEDGLSLIAALRALRPGLPAALVTAVRERAVLASAELAGIIVLAKPVAPEAIEAFLAEVAPALA